MPEAKEAFISDVIDGTTVGAITYSKFVGTGSSRQVVEWLPVMMTKTDCVFICGPE